MPFLHLQQQLVRAEVVKFGSLRSLLGMTQVFTRVTKLT